LCLRQREGDLLIRVSAALHDTPPGDQSARKNCISPRPSIRVTIIGRRLAC
jgi:hypothetical protein